MSNEEFLAKLAGLIAEFERGTGPQDRTFVAAMTVVLGDDVDIHARPVVVYKVHVWDGEGFVVETGEASLRRVE